MNTFISISLFVLAVTLLIMDSYFSSLIFYLLGLFYIIMGWSLRNKDQKSAKGTFIIGLFIATVTFLGDFIIGYTQQETIQILQETIAALKNKN